MANSFDLAKRVSKAGQPPADTPRGLIAGCIAVAILGMLFNTLSGSDSSS